MSEEKKEGCCGTHGSAGPCCAGKKVLFAVLIGALLFIAGMMFARVSGGGSICPFAPAQPR